MTNATTTLTLTGLIVRQCVGLDAVGIAIEGTARVFDRMDAGDLAGEEEAGSESGRLAAGDETAGERPQGLQRGHGGSNRVSVTIVLGRQCLGMQIEIDGSGDFQGRE